MYAASLHPLRQRARRIAALAVAVFALNWLGLALAPCAMAFAVPASDAHAPAAHVAVQEHCPHCPPPDAPPCHESAATPASGDACGATPKPALEPRDAKLAAAAPLLIALSGPTLAVEPVPLLQRRGYAAVDPAPRPEVAPPDRYCRRLE